MLVELRLAQDSGETALARRFGPEARVVEEQTRGFGSLHLGDFDDVAWRYCDLTRERCVVVWSTDKQIQRAKRSQHFGFLQALKDRKAAQEESHEASRQLHAPAPKFPKCGNPLKPPSGPRGRFCGCKSCRACNGTAPFTAKDQRLKG